MNLQCAKNELDNISRTSFGISIPSVRRLAKRIAKENYEEILNTNDFSSFELKILHAFTIGYIKADVKDSLAYFEKFIPQVDHWAINDSLCQNFKIARVEQKIVWKFLMKYLDTTKEFESRIISVILLSHYLNDEYIDRVFDVLNRLSTQDYYSQMGVAWAVATIMAKYPQKCLKYLQSAKCNLDKKTYNKSLQKIRESLQIPEKIKIITREMIKN